MSYCNAGPAVAAYIVEEITGQRFEDYVTQTFFGPIGMKTATYFRPASAPLTTLYHPDGTTPRRTDTGRFSIVRRARSTLPPITWGFTFRSISSAAS